MALSVVDLYRDVLPQTNCGDCGFPTCIAFASRVVADQLPLKTCPHLSEETVERCRPELEAQYAEGRWTRRDMLADALRWARERAAKTELADLPERLGGTLVDGPAVDGPAVGGPDGPRLRLPYFRDAVLLGGPEVQREDGSPLDRWEQVFLLNHMAQGGSARPSGRWKAFQEFPNTVSKVKSMRAHVEEPLAERFAGAGERLASRAEILGGTTAGGDAPSADVAIRLTPLPRVPVLLLFWDADPEEGTGAQVRLLFDETVTGHLDIESILFLSERIAALLGGTDQDSAPDSPPAP
jgi:hypothetical protein